MDQATIIGIDLAKHSFQIHGARADGSVAFRKKLIRGKVLDVLASQPPSVVAMEACASAHHWGRETEKLGHEVKLVPPIYVKPFVKRQKNDTTDAEAICEAAQRPTMSFVAVKTKEQQARGMLPSRRHSSAIGSSPRSPAGTMRLWTPPVMQEIFGTARCMWSGAVVYPAFWCGLQSPLACMEIRGSGPNRIYGLQSALALCWFSPSRLVDRLSATNAVRPVAIRGPAVTRGSFRHGLARFL